MAEPDEALIISGLRASGRPVGTGESMGFNIVTGRGALILPGLTKVRRLSLEAHESEITVPCVSQQKIQVDLRGIVVYKVGDDYQSIANAARRFLDRPATELETKVQNVFVGHLRAIAGSMTVEDMISDQDKFTQQVRDRCTQEMESFGLVIDSFQIQAITSPSAYIENLAVPHQAEVEQNARIARANAEREAVAQEQTAQAQIAESTRNTEIKKAGYQAEIDQATKQAEQQGPLAEAKARQAVVEQDAGSPSSRPSKRSSSSRSTSGSPPTPKPTARPPWPRLPGCPDPASRGGRPGGPPGRRGCGGADAGPGPGPGRSGHGPGRGAGRGHRLTGEAEGDAIRARGVAEADAVKARMEAEAAGIELRAAALNRNQEAVIAQQIAANLPEIVRAAASSFEHVGTFTVLNGAAGVTETLAEMIQQAGVLANIARQTMVPMLGAQNGEGSAPSSEHPSRSGQPAVVPPGSRRREGRVRPGSAPDAPPAASSTETAPEQPDER